MNKSKCKKCSYEWLPRIIKPKQCPNCKNPNWSRLDYFDGKREVVLKRDKYKCRKCGNTGRLYVHHKDNNKKNNRMSNFLTLCAVCHKHAHHPLSMFMTITEFAKKLKVSTHRIYDLRHKSAFKDCFDEEIIQIKRTIIKDKRSENKIKNALK